MQVSVDTDRCCGSGNCVLIAPDVFDQTEDEGIVVLREPEPLDELQPGVREAARVCPTEAIRFIE
jgi:ferredoxin